LDLTRLDAGKIEPLFDVVDVQALGQETVAMMSSKAQRKQVNLSMRGESAQPLYLKADATILRQVLLNLISNAIKVRHS
jgi:signal transduction histidine kinase